MGTTIKRQPINFKIPNSPDYKYLNITDFQGVHISDNPFELNPNTASDSLNVYVDETNTLTTRPRLETVMDLTKHMNITELTAVYNLLDGYLIHFKHPKKTSKMCIIKSDGSINEISVSDSDINYIPPNKCVVFEQNGLIYLLSNDYGYLQIQNNILSKVDGYVPTTRVGKNAIYVDENGNEHVDEAGVDYEPFNLLSDKYKETYFWKGTTNPFKLDVSGDIEINSDFCKYFTTSFYTRVSPDSYDSVYWLPLKYLSEYYDGENYNTKHWLVRGLDDPTKIGVFSKGDSNTFTSLSTPATLPTHYDYVTADASVDGQIKVCVYTHQHIYNDVVNDDTLKVGGVYLYKGDDVSLISNDDDQFITYDSRIPTYTDMHRIRVSANGDVIATYSQKNIIIWKKINGTYKRFSKSISFTKPEGYYDEFYPSGLELSENGNTLVIKCDPFNYGLTKTPMYLGVITNILDITDSSQITMEEIYSLNRFSYCTAISPNGNFVAFKSVNSKEISIKDLSKNSISSVEIPNYEETSSLWFTYSTTGNKLYYFTTNISGWIMTKDLTVVPYNYVTQYNNVNYSSVIPIGNVQLYATDSEINIYYSRFNYELRGCRFVFDISGKEPTVTITHTITRTDKIYDSWVEKCGLLNRANITTRFQNDRWFAYKNYTFYTKNNDPSYVPISSYNELSNSEEYITGFNIIEDNTLVAYKANSLYVIQPTTINNVSTFAYTVTKNTTGNDGWNSPIITTLTETPLHVSIDGIFALNQLENVQSSDRIAVLANSTINQKWLKEPEREKINTITLNRLYWTYFILSSDTKTKVYLLDNRTHTWFYWELPCVINDAFVKDNVVCFVSKDSKIYNLKNNEVVNEFNPNLTEYYDEGRQIIPWYWRSQILPLGTINYSKKLISTTFVFTDTDATDEYSLNYSFRIFRKTASDTAPLTITNKLNYVQSTTKKTFASRFNFIQIELSNTEEDLNNNKLRLIGLGLKYELLEGLL